MTFLYFEEYHKMLFMVPVIDLESFDLTTQKSALFLISKISTLLFPKYFIAEVLCMLGKLEFTNTKTECYNFTKGNVFVCFI